MFPAVTILSAILALASLDTAQVQSGVRLSEVDSLQSSVYRLKTNDLRLQIDCPTEASSLTRWRSGLELFLDASLGSQEPTPPNGWRRWVVPGLVTVGAGAVVYTVYRVRGR